MKDQKWTMKYDLGIEPLPLAVNTSAEYFEREREKIFRHAWLNVGRVEDLPAAGSYFVKELAILRTSALVVRGRDGEIRSFHNMCKHRGNKVVRDGIGSGTGRGFSCNFHGWTYDLTGQLVYVPDEGEFFGLDKCANGLTPIATEVWEGFIFINAEPRESLREWLGELADQFQGYYEKDWHCFAHNAADVQVNWKVFIDAFAEGYHVPTVHGRTLPEAITPEMNSLCHPIMIRLFKRNRSIIFGANPSYQPTPVEKVLASQVAAPVFPALKSQLENLPPGVNPTKDAYWGFDINIVFPVTYFVNWANGMLLIYHFWPLTVDRTRWEMKLYWDKPKNAAERLNQEYVKTMTACVVREDLTTQESTQSMLRSGATSHMNLSDQEIAVRHGYKVVEEALNNA